MNSPTVPNSNPTSDSNQQFDPNSPFAANSASNDYPAVEAPLPPQSYGTSPGYVTAQNYGGSGSYGGPGSYPVQYSSHQPPRAEEDPGKVLGIISLVATLSTFLGFNFIGPIVGIITGHMARKNSRSAGLADNAMGKWGFILGIVFVSVAVLGGLLGLSIGAFTGLFGLLGS